MPFEMKTLAGSCKTHTIADSVVQLTDTSGAVPVDVDGDQARAVWIQALDAAVRYTTDGTDPAPGSDTGFVLYADERVLLGVQDALAAKFIREGSTSAKLISSAHRYA